MFLGQFNQTLNDSSKQSMAQSQRLQPLETSRNSNTPPLDFNRLSPEQQFLIKTWSQKQQEELLGLSVNILPIHQSQSFFTTVQQPQQNQFLLQQQQLIDNYNQQFQTIVPEQQQQQDQQLDQQAQLLQQQQLEQQQLLFQQQQQFLQQQQQLKTQYDSNYLKMKYDESCNQILKTMPSHQSLNEPQMPLLYKYFDVDSELQNDHLNLQHYILTHKLNPSYKLSLRVFIFDKYTIYEQQEKQLQLQKQQLTHANLINIHLIHTKKYVCMCFATFRVCVLLDYIHSDCESTIKHKHYQEHEIWLILQNMVEALYSLHLKGIVHGNVTLDHIVLTHLIDNSQLYKLIYRNQETNVLQKKFQNQQNKILLSNELYNSFLMNDQSAMPSWKSDVFQLGLCILQLCLGPHKYENVYEIYQNVFDEYRLNQLIKEVDTNYSYKLVQYLQFMLTTNQDIRPDWIRLEAKISELQPIQPINIIYNFEVQQRIETKITKSRANSKNVSYSHVNSFRISPIGEPQSKPQMEDIKEITTKNNLIVENRNKRKMNCNDGGTYYGEVLNGLRDGLGQYVSNEFSYDGCWKNDKYNGKGTLYQNGKLIYEGSFKYGEYDGYGKATNPNPKYFNSLFDYKDFTKLGQQWIHYMGDFKEGEFCGFGQLELSNGEKVTCVFMNGLPNGVGVFETLDKRRLNAQWDMGLLIRRI
ncbi:unnamed protein product [Paramecium primaurelia]|uniref:Protein kinase domain-containing protein n=1 Tax=Paramecium primaurelia TaxID=5886 RepID=A0A8S1P4T6_PARPR|nr:unnamed protein product [Paramecium primaurelia]